MFTSGSTGKPKGVEISHKSVVNVLSDIAQGVGLQDGDRLLALTTISFDIAALELFMPLMRGGTVCIASTEEASEGRKLWERMTRSEPGVIQATPSRWRMLMEEKQGGEWRFKAICGGEALPMKIGRAMVKQVEGLWNVYGPTETTIWSTIHRHREG